MFVILFWKCLLFWFHQGKTRHVLVQNRNENSDNSWSPLRVCREPCVNALFERNLTVYLRAFIPTEETRSLPSCASLRYFLDPCFNVSSATQVQEVSVARVLSCTGCWGSMRRPWIDRCMAVRLILWDDGHPRPEVPKQLLRFSSGHLLKATRLNDELTIVRFDANVVNEAEHNRPHFEWQKCQVDLRSCRHLSDKQPRLQGLVLLFFVSL